MKLHKRIFKLFTCFTLLIGLTTPIKANDEENIFENEQKIYDLSEIDEKEIPSIENGWIPVGTSELGINLYTDDGENLIQGIIPEGTVWFKLINTIVTVDGKQFGPGSPEEHYVAYIKDSNGNDLMCLEPHKNLIAGTQLEVAYNSIEYRPGSKVDVDGGGADTTTLAKIWYFATQWYPKNSKGTDYASLRAEDWYFIGQTKIWEAEGFGVDWLSMDPIYAAAAGAVDYQIQKFEEFETVPDNLKIKKKIFADPSKPEAWQESDGYEWEEYISGSVINFDDPAYVFNGKAIVRTTSVDLYDKLLTNYDTMTKSVKVSYGGGTTLAGDPEGEGIPYKTYEFTKSSAPEAGAYINYSYVPESLNRTSYVLTGNDPMLQSVMSLQFTAKNRQIKFLFSSEGAPDVPDTPPSIKVPDFTKTDEDDGFAVQGATYEIKAAQNYKMDWVVEKKVLTESVYTDPVPCTNNPDTGACEGGSPGYWTYTYEIKDPVPASANGTYKPQNIFDSSTYSFGEFTTDANGKIDLTPVVTEIQQKVEEHKLESATQNEPSSWGDTVTNDKIPSSELSYYYVDPNYYFKNGQFSYQEPEASKNQFNDNAVSVGDTDFVGYYNPFPSKKTKFTINENSPNIETTNTRQRGRITVHKTDNETSYLNHNNSHESQGDGYFYGAVFVVTAREDVVLHDGSYAQSVFNGKDLVAGEIADVIMTDTNGTATTDYLDLGKYNIQEIRLPGVYKNNALLPGNLDNMLDKDSVFYERDLAAAEALFLSGKLPSNFADGGYWYKNYTNTTDNPSTLYTITGGQVEAVDIKYVGQDFETEEVVPGCYQTGDAGDHVTVNGETVQHTIPKSLGDDHYTKNNALDYANSIQKGHLQLQKRISDVPDDNGQLSSIGNMNVSDVYFAIYLNNKSDQQLIEPLPDKYFAQQRLDGRVYTFDADGNFYRDAKGNILYSDGGDIVPELKGWINPSKYVQETSDITDKNLNEKDLYMVLKTNKLGQAGTNIPETIVYANKAVSANTGINGSYGDYDYANPNKLLASGLPLPYGTYTVLELNPYEGYYPVSYQVTISRDTTDINGVVTELGIETGNQAEDTLRKQFWIFSDRLVESTIKDDLIRQNIEVTKRDVETGKLIPAANTNFMIWQWNTAFNLDDDHKRMDWIKDKLVTDDQGNYVCLDEFTVCTYPNGLPMEAAVKKDELPTYNEATSAQRNAGEYQHWDIYYVEYEQVQDNPGMIGGSTHTVVHRYDDKNDFTQMREKDGKIITDKVGNWVSRTYTEPDQYGKTTRTIYSTNTEGQFTLPAGDPLIYGEYLLCEISAPYGYTISSTPTLFKVEHDGSSVEPNAPIELVTIQLDQPNMPQKASVNVIKKGEVLQGFERYTTLLGADAWKPVYADGQVEDVTTFEVYAEEDIVVNNDVKFTAGTLVDTISTDQYGNGSSIELYLGKYYLKEKEAPSGYLTDGTPMPFELTYKGQNVSVYPIYKEQTNTRQNLQIKVLKRLSNGQQANDVYFGVYSKNEIKLKEPIKVITPEYDTDDWYDGDYGFIHPSNPDTDNLIITSDVPVFTAESDFEFLNGTITNYTGSSTNVVVPTTIGGVDVTAIDDNAFAGKGLTSIVLPSSIETIGATALANNDLSSIEFFNYDYLSGVATINLTIDVSWTNYNPMLQKIIVPVGTKTVFDQLIDADEDGCMEYIPIVEKQVEDDMSFGRPTIHESVKELNTLPAGTLLEIIRVQNGVGTSTLDYPEGEYYLIEVQVPEGVKIDDETMYEVDFEFDAAAGNTQVITINNGEPIINQTTDKPDEPDHPTPKPTPGKKTIILDIDTKKSMEQDLLYGNTQAYKEILFGVYASEDLYDGKKLIYAKDQLVFQSGIDAAGDFLEVMSTENMEIPEGDYYVKEIKTHADYILDDTKYPFTYEQEKRTYYYTIDLTNHTMVNELKRTHIIVYKVDRQDESKVLAHAEFTLYDKDMNVLEVQVTGDDGIARFNNLPDGKYYVQETATPAGYTPSNEIREVTILGAETLESKNNEYIIKWSNVLLPAFGEEVETGVDRHIEIAISVAVLSSAALLILMKRKKSNE